MNPAEGAEQATFDTYLADAAARSLVTARRAARRGDPDVFDACVEAVRAAARDLATFSTDDIRWDVRGPEVGAAFSHLRGAGEIETCGYRTSRRPLSHGRLIRVWRAT